MAEFQIWSSDGQTVRATGSPVYNGTFLKPGYLEFQEIGSPVPIGLAAGDYVDYPRTGLRYKLYNTPKVLKQGERNRYGGSFVYENVQFFDITKELEIAPFIDLVPFDNLIHFSTRNSVAFYGTPANVAERIQACLEYWFPTSGWVVDVISGLDPEDDAELIETLATETDFSVSGISCLGALDRVYELWNGLGWSYSNTGGVNRITIGAPNKRTAGNTTASYGRINDNGLVTLARSVSNTEEMGTRLYAYGSMRNMPTDYYRSKDIKDAESVDIAHLMLPIDPVASLDYDGWGETDGLPDARLAYIEDADAIAKYGLIPRYAYFDGSDSEYPDIYPSLSGVTIGDVIDGKEQMSDTSYVPDLTKWSRGDRVDEIVSAVNPADNGGASAGGSQYSESGTFATTPATIDTSISGSPVEEIIGNFSPIAPSDTLYMTLDLSGTVSISGSADSSWFEMRVRVEGVSPTSNASSEVLVPLIDIGEDDRFAFSLEGVSFDLNLPGMTSVRVYFHVEKTGWELLDCEVSVNAGSVFLGWSSSLGRTFKATIPQIGFNILQYADMGGGKTLSMLTGMCAGRGFPIKAASYDPSNDAWVLTLGRVKDSDTGLWYPNSDFEVAQGDQYVLLDIAMPELYIAMASIRLLKAAQRLLGAISEESPFYEPDIDSKKVVGESRVLKAGMWMHLIGDEIVDGGEDYSLIDTLRIDENASNIPVYEVTLRKRKPIEWTETSSGGSVEKPTSTPVDETVQQTSARPPDWFVVESYEEDNVTKQRLKLNPKYQGMYADGWVSAGGLSDSGGGVVGDYLPLAGGTMEGNIYMPTGSSTNSGPTLYFRHMGTSAYVFDSYIGANSSGTLAVFARNDIRLRPGNSSNYGLVVGTNKLTFNNRSVIYHGLYSYDTNTTGYGILVKTTIKPTTEAMPTFHITGMAYGETMCVDTTVSFWNRSGSTDTGPMGSASGVCNGYDLGTIYAFVHNPDDSEHPFDDNGRVYLWFGRPSRYSNIYVRILNAFGTSYESGIESITYAAMPGDSAISRKTSITPERTGGSISEATTGALGGFKLSVAKRTTNVPSSSFNTGGTTSGRYYGVEMNNSGQLYVNVPWQSGSGGSNVAWGTTSNHKATLTVDGNTKTVLLDGWSQDLSSYAPLASPAFTGNPTAPTQSSGNNSTRIATTAFVQTAVSGYLPLTAGSGKALTGSLYSQSIIPTGTSKTYNLGSTSKFFKYAYVDRIYLGGTGVYIYVDNGCVRTNAPIVSDSYISAGGVSTT